MNFKTTLLAASLVAAGGVASASTMISIQTFSDAAYDAYVANTKVLATEDFEGFEAEVQGALPMTAVGSFSTLGPTGSGDSVVGDGTEVAVRDGSTVDPFGRVNTTQGDDAKNWLDSNDTTGIVWDAELDGVFFDEVAFSLSDATDQGATLSVIAGGETASFSGLGNGNVQWVIVSFMDSVDMATITLSNNDQLNDGFGIDDATIAAVPLPAGLLLLGTALGGLGIARRRKTA